MEFYSFLSKQIIYLKKLIILYIDTCACIVIEIDRTLIFDMLVCVSDLLHIVPITMF